jgi:hypothetical protein
VCAISRIWVCAISCAVCEGKGARGFVFRSVNFAPSSGRNRASAIRHNEIARWFRELQFYGFIVMTKGGSLGVEGKGKAPHWRLTELGYMLVRSNFLDGDSLRKVDAAVVMQILRVAPP